MLRANVERSSRERMAHVWMQLTQREEITPQLLQRQLVFPPQPAEDERLDQVVERELTTERPSMRRLNRCLARRRYGSLPPQRDGLRPRVHVRVGPPDNVGTPPDLPQR